MKRLIFIIIPLVIGVAIGWLGKSAVRPENPAHWNNLKLGMTPREAKETVPGLDLSLRDMKGFDQDGLDYGDRYWNLLVSYDEEGRVSEITKKYVDRRLGLFNTLLVEANL